MRILEAAEQVFAAGGVGTSTEEVAKQAGVGIGTVFRHFPTKEALLEAVYRQRIQSLAVEAESLAAAENAGEAFFGFFGRLVAQSESKNAYAEALAEAGVDVRNPPSEAGQRLLAALGTLLRRAQESGEVRDDIGVPEIVVLLISAVRAEGDARVRAKVVGVLFDGLRPGRGG